MKTPGRESPTRFEKPDPTPVEMPAGLSKPESMDDMIRRFVRIEASKVAQNAGMETFEEANDFEPDELEPDDLPTPYYVPEMTPELAPDGTLETLDGGSNTGETGEPERTAPQVDGQSGEINSPGHPPPGSGGGTPPAPGGVSDAPQT